MAEQPISFCTVKSYSSSQQRCNQGATAAALNNSEAVMRKIPYVFPKIKSRDQQSATQIGISTTRRVFSRKFGMQISIVPYVA